MTRARSKGGTAEAIRLFPRGLAQPARGFRFGLDALLLASFLPGGPERLLDLGTGCGAVALGWLLREDSKTDRVRAVGLEMNPEQAACARENGARLGLTERFEVIESDVRSIRTSTRPESFDLVACNPPYRGQGTGRLPADAGRRAAIFAGHAGEGQGASASAGSAKMTRMAKKAEDTSESTETEDPRRPEIPAQAGTSGVSEPDKADSGRPAAGLADFIAAAAYALPERGRACFVFMAERLPVLLAGFAAHGLEPKRLRLAHPRREAPARLAFVEARKRGGQGLVVEPPLFLYKGTRLTTDALAFCPFLSCNSGSNEGDERL